MLTATQCSLLLCHWRAMILLLLKHINNRVFQFQKLVLSRFLWCHRSHHVRISQVASLNVWICEKNISTFNTHDIELLSVRFGEKLKVVYSLFQ